MTALQKNAQENLKRLVDQIERLEGEKRDICDDIKDKFAEAKSSGFDVKVLRRLLKLRKQSKEDRSEEEAVLATYMAALGMDGTPIDAWAKSRERAKELAN